MEVALAYFKALLYYLTEVTEKNRESNPVTTTDLRAEIQTGDFSPLSTRRDGTVRTSSQDYWGSTPVVGTGTQAEVALICQVPGSNLGYSD
jgi:hypothetical protein